jgi:hypothetical protein
MPGSYAIDTGRSLVLSRGWGVLTDGELLAHVRALAIDQRFAPHFCQLADLRDVTTFEVSSATIRAMASLNPFGVGARRALVVGSDVAFGMARMYQILRDESPDVFEIFREIVPALDWLGLADARHELIAALLAAPPISILA